MKLQAFLISGLYLLARFVIRLFPRKLWLRLFGFVAWILGSFPLGPAHKTLNVIQSRRKALGMPLLNTRKVLRINIFYLFKNFVDFFHLLDGPPQKFMSLVHCSSEELVRLHQYRDSQKGTLVWSPHWGNWEAGAIFMAVNDCPLGSLYFEQIDKGLNGRINQVRQNVGTRLFHQRKGLRQAVEFLKSGGFLCILGDQDGTRAGCFLEFCGLLCSFPRASELFLKKSDAAFVPVYCAHRGDAYEFRVFPEIPFSQEELRESPQTFHRRIAILLETMVLEEPEQWLLFYDRFKFRHNSRLQEWGIEDFCRSSFQKAWKGEIPPKVSEPYQSGRIG